MEPADPHAGKVMKMAAQQEKPMISTQRAEPAGGTAGPGASSGATAGGNPISAATSPAFRIRWGRLVLAVAGLLSLLTGVVSAALRLFGIGSGWLPVTALLGAVAAVALLRRLAVRDRRRKMNAAFRAAMGSPERTTARPSGPEQIPSLPAGRPGCPAGKPSLRRRSGPGHARACAEAADRTGAPPGRPRRSGSLGGYLGGCGSRNGGSRGGLQLGARRCSQAHLRRSGRRPNAQPPCPSTSLRRRRPSGSRRSSRPPRGRPRPIRRPPTIPSQSSSARPRAP